MVAMIRKQLYIEAKQQAKLRSLARRWRCTEAEVMRKAIDRLADSDDLDSLVIQRLSEAGLLVTPADDADLPSPDQAEEWEKKEMEWLAKQPPAGLGEAILDERRSGW